MNLNAVTKNISDLFSINKKYQIPRFQRPYSWRVEQIRELWFDIMENIKYDNESDSFENSQYFIGAVVLVESNQNLLSIVDGQQRLTTITMLLSALCRNFESYGRGQMSKAIYTNYISGLDDNGHEYFKLESESPKPFFQTEIQYKEEKKENVAKTDEEKNIENNFKELLRLTGIKNLNEAFNKNQGDKDFYLKALEALRKQVLSYLSVIHITVEEEEEAYTIFETLNARGIDLSSVDLIKNTIFKKMKDTHPDDTAKTKWKSICDNISTKSSTSNTLDDYVRHWWLSRYSNTSKETLYKKFIREIKLDTFTAEEFLNDLKDDSTVYRKISDPKKEDFSEKEYLHIYMSLRNLKMFSISQHKPLFISLFRGKRKGVIKLSDFVEVSKFIEDFHFSFNAICSKRPSGLDQIYARSARDLFKCNNKKESKEVLDSLMDQLKGKAPEKEVFIRGFDKILYMNKKEKDKKIVQYIFTKIEFSNFGNKEFYPENMTLEHIEPQSSKVIDKNYLGKIGNILPLASDLNNKAGNKSVVDKIDIYKESDFILTKEFGEKFDGDWSGEKIDRRTEELAIKYFDEILFK